MCEMNLRCGPSGVTCRVCGHTLDRALVPGASWQACEEGIRECLCKRLRLDVAVGGHSRRGSKVRHWEGGAVEPIDINALSPT